MVEIKYSTPRIGTLPVEQLTMHTRAILLRIHVATGWALPDDEAYIAVLESEFTKYLQESCSDMNVDEISYAVRTCGVDIQDWGKNMNLQLIDQAIARYRARRAEISRIEEQATLSAENQLPAPETPKEADWTEAWEDIKRAAASGHIKTAIIPVAVYDWLVRTGMLSLTVQEKKTLYSQALEQYCQDLVTLASTGRLSHDDRIEMKKLKEPDWENRYPDLQVRIANKAKQQAIRELAMTETI